jgi:archaellin
MASFEQVPVTAAVFSVVTILLSGCIAYDATRTVVDSGTTVVGTGISLVSSTGTLVLSPLVQSDTSKPR